MRHRIVTLKQFHGRRASRIVLIFVLLSFCLSGLAQNSRSASSPLTLDSAIAYARQHSPLLHAARQGVLTKQAEIAASRAERLPQADVDAALRAGNQPTESAIGFPLTSLADIPAQPLANAHLNGAVGVSVPLYDGGRIGAETHIAEAERNFAQSNVKDVGSNLEYEVAVTYARIVQVGSDVRAARESVAALTKSQRNARQMLNVGTIARVDLLEVDTRLADVRSELIDLENEKQILAGQLNALMGRPIGTPVVVETSLPHPGIAISAERAAQDAATGNPQYQLAEARTKVAQQSVELAKSKLRPTLSFSAIFFKQSPDPFSVYRGGATAGFSFSYPIFNRPLRHRVQEARSAELENHWKEDQARLDATQRARTAALQIQDAEARIRATESSIAEARETLRIEQEKLRSGRGIMEHLLDAQAALLTSEADYYRALADYAIATASLNRETGR